MNTALTQGLQLSVRAAVAAALAVSIAQYLKFEHPVYAVIAAVIVMDLSPATTRKLAIQRLLGTLLAAVVGAVVSFLLPSEPSGIAVGVAVAMLLSHVVHLGGAAKLAGFVSGIIVLAHSADPWSYALDRTLETVLGIAVAVLVSYVPKLLKVEVPDAGGSRS